MKSLFQRMTAVLLVVLLAVGAVGPVTAAYSTFSPVCTLGTDPSDMLSGGGRQVLVGELQYYIDDADGSVYELSRPDQVVVEGPVAGLNYADGVLYYARLREADFALCAFDLEAGTERVLLKTFSGSVRQLYLVNDKALEFSTGDEVWSFSLTDGTCTLLLTAPELWSFVPTGCGLIYATGSLFDYTLFANGQLLARHVQDYTVRFDLKDGALVYTCGGDDYQMDLSAAFGGTGEVRAYDGYPFIPEEECGEEEAWEWYVPSPGTGITRSVSGYVTEAEAYSRGKVALFPKDGLLRMQAKEGTLNIVRRARQMLNIQWTPVGDVGFGGWGYTDLSYDLQIFYEPGVTYRGLPYGQAMSYVPWNTSYYGFLNSVRDVNSKLYNERCTYKRGSQYYGTDCSGFASWAWATTVNGTSTPQRKTCSSMMAWNNTSKIGRSYSQIQVGDALISSAHAVLVTDVAYNLDGTMTSIEISQANPTSAYNGCCYSTRYTGSAALQRLNTNYFVKGSYSIYRNKARDSVTYTHDCCVPVEGDVCTICGCGTKPEPENPDVKIGIDVSYAQGTVNWKTVSTQVDFALLRVGYTGNTQGGIYKDSTIAANIKGCTENKIPFGLYYYAGATTPEKAMEEADAVLGWLLEIGATPSLPIFYDVEETRNILKLSSEQLAQVCAAFCDHLEDFGFKAGVYASSSIWNSKMKSSTYDRMSHWVAHWDTSRMTALAGANVWQYTSTGKIAGISGDVDMNYWIGSLGSTEHPSTAVLTAPACVDGKLVSACVKCSLVQEQPIKGVGHTPGRTEAKTEVEPTCTETGVYDEITYCSICGQVASHMTLTREPLGHSWTLTGVLAQDLVPEPLDIASELSSLPTEGVDVSAFLQDDPTTDSSPVENEVVSEDPDGLLSTESPLEKSESVHDRTGQYTCSRCGETKEAPLCAGEIFTDMPKKSHWAHAAIDWAYFNGLFKGVSDHAFGLDMTMDRAMLVTVLYSIAGRPAVEGTIPFRDVKKKSYYYQPVLWAYQMGIAGGTGDNTFSPTAPVTREQVAVMLLGYLRSQGQEPEIHKEIIADYPDVGRISDFAVSGMAWAVEQGILSGSPVDNVVYLFPRSTATRAQVAVMFMQFTKLLQSQGLWSPPKNYGLTELRLPHDGANSER